MFEHYIDTVLTAWEVIYAMAIEDGLLRIMHILYL